MKFKGAMSRPHVPGLPANYLARERLLKLLDSNSRNRLTLITAPAGFGKTALASWWASTSRENICWVTLCEEDDLYQVFLVRMIEALQTVCADIGKFMQSALRDGHDVSPRSAANSILNEIVTSGISVTLVLDDFQSINNPTIHSIVEWLLRIPSTCLDVVIISRRDPPLRIASMRALGHTTEIRVNELRLNQTETETYLNDTLGLELDTESVKLIAQRCEGWIAGLRLVAYTLAEKTADQKREALRSFSESSHFIFDFLNEEVFEMQPESVKEFLLKTCILDSLTGPLCEAVVGAETAQIGLEVLEHSDLFLIRTDPDKGEFRYHKLFLDFLRHRLKQTFPGLKPQLHLRASDWYARNGYELPALRHVLLALNVPGPNQNRSSTDDSHAVADWYFQEANIDAIQEWLLTGGIPVSSSEAALLPYRDWALLWARGARSWSV